MRLWKKIGLTAIGLIAVAGLTAAGYVSARWDHRYDDVAGPDLEVSTDSAVIARGEYLVRGPAHCSSCHVGSFDEALRVDRGEKLPLRGGVEFAMGPLGALSPANLTPDSVTGIGRYTDRLLFRMLRHTIKPDGTASIWPMMPFFMMADEDLIAIVSYLRSQPPVRNPVPAARYTAMGKVIRVLSPGFEPRLGHTAPAVAPPSAPTKERGEYIARYVANCVGCHTNHNPATAAFTGPEFAGGAVFAMPPGYLGDSSGFTYRSPNLTPDPGGVLARFGSKANWIARFRQGRILQGSPMYWGSFSRMSEADLEALWIYFNSLPPIKNDIGPTAFKDQ